MTDPGTEPPPSTSAPAPLRASYTGVLRCFGEGFHMMRLDGAVTEHLDASPLVVVAFPRTYQRAFAASLIGSRVRIAGTVETGVVVDGARGARVVVDVLVHAEHVEDLEPKPSPPSLAPRPYAAPSRYPPRRR